MSIKPIRGHIDVLYFKKTEDGRFKPVEPSTAAESETLYSLVRTKLDENGIPQGYFYYIPKVVFSSDIEVQIPEVISTNDVTGISPVENTGIFFYVDGKKVETSLPITNDIDLIIGAINEAVADKLGQKYNRFAERYPGSASRRIRLSTPDGKNSHIVIPENKLLNEQLYLPKGQYYGDLPVEYRSYLIEEEFILVQESVTPNKGIPSGRFFEVKEENGILRYFSEFDRNLITQNIRLNMLIDGFALLLERINQEIDRFIDQIDLSKIDLPNLEYLAYMFGINLESLLKNSEENILSAREILRSLMHIIQNKGTKFSFNLILRFLRLVSDVIELRPGDDESINDYIDKNAVIDFYNRFLFENSPFRNPVINYGTIVPSLEDLPQNGIEGEYVKVTNENSIYQFNGGNWVPVFNSLDPVFGSGNPPSEELEKLNWVLVEKNRPYSKIPLSTYNKLQILGKNPSSPQDHGLSIQVGNGITFSGVDSYYNITKDTSIATNEQDTLYNAFIVSSKSGPYDLSNIADRVLEILVDEKEYIKIDFSEHLNSIKNISSVSISEIKRIIETNYPSLAVSEVDLTGTGIFGFALVSKTFGSGSSLRILNGNIKLGFETSAFAKVPKITDVIKLTSGDVFITPGANIPELTITGRIFAIRSIEDTPPLDGVYKIFIDNEDDIIIVSDKPFYGSLFDPSKGYISKEFSQENVLEIGSVTVENGEFVGIKQNPRASDYEPDVVLTDEQQYAVRGFIRSKFNTAEDYRFDTSKPGVYTEGTTLSVLADTLREMTDGPFYDRNGTRNPNQIKEPGISNNIILSTSPFSSDYNLTQDIIEQLDKFIEYVRPAHIQLLNLLFSVPEFKDVWDRWDKNEGGLNTSARNKPTLGALERSSENPNLWMYFLFPEYEPGKKYFQGSIVWYQGQLYAVTIVETTNPPTSADWQSFDLPSHRLDILDILERSILFNDFWFTEGEELAQEYDTDDLIGFRIDIDSTTDWENPVFVFNPNSRIVRFFAKNNSSFFPSVQDRRNSFITDVKLVSATDSDNDGQYELTYEVSTPYTDNQTQHNYNPLKNPMVVANYRGVIIDNVQEDAYVKTVGQELKVGQNRVTTAIEYDRYISTLSKGISTRKLNVDISTIQPEFAELKGALNPALKGAGSLENISQSPKEIALGATYLKGSENQVSLDSNDAYLSGVKIDENGVAVYNGSFGLDGYVIPKNHSMHNSEAIIIDIYSAGENIDYETYIQNSVNYYWSLSKNTTSETATGIDGGVDISITGNANTAGENININRNVVITFSNSFTVEPSIGSLVTNTDTGATAEIVVTTSNSVTVRNALGLFEPGDTISFSDQNTDPSTNVIDNTFVPVYSTELLDDSEIVAPSSQNNIQVEDKFSLEFWFKKTYASSPDFNITGSLGGTSDDFKIGISGDEIYLSVDSGSGLTVIGRAKFQFDVPHLISYVFDKGMHKVYIDGSEKISVIRVFRPDVMNSFSNGSSVDLSLTFKREAAATQYGELEIDTRLGTSITLEPGKMFTLSINGEENEYDLTSVAPSYPDLRELKDRIQTHHEGDLLDITLSENNRLLKIISKKPDISFTDETGGTANYASFLTKISDAYYKFISESEFPIQNFSVHQNGSACTINTGNPVIDSVNINPVDNVFSGSLKLIGSGTSKSDFVPDSVKIENISVSDDNLSLSAWIKKEQGVMPEFTISGNFSGTVPVVDFVIGISGSKTSFNITLSINTGSGLNEVASATISSQDAFHIAYVFSRNGTENHKIFVNGTEVISYTGDTFPTGLGNLKLFLSQEQAIGNRYVTFDTTNVDNIELSGTIDISVNGNSVLIDYTQLPSFPDLSELESIIISTFGNDVITTLSSSNRVLVVEDVSESSPSIIVTDSTGISVSYDEFIDSVSDYHWNFSELNYPVISKGIIGSVAPVSFSPENVPGNSPLLGGPAINPYDSEGNSVVFEYNTLRRLVTNEELSFFNGTGQSIEFWTKRDLLSVATLSINGQPNNGQSGLRIELDGKNYVKAYIGLTEILSAKINDDYDAYVSQISNYHWNLDGSLSEISGSDLYISSGNVSYGGNINVNKNSLWNSLVLDQQATIYSPSLPVTPGFSCEFWVQRESGIQEQFTFTVSVNNGSSVFFVVDEDYNGPFVEFYVMGTLINTIQIQHDTPYLITYVFDHSSGHNVFVNSVLEISTGLNGFNPNFSETAISLQRLSSPWANKIEWDSANTNVYPDILDDFTGNIDVRLEGLNSYQVTNSDYQGSSSALVKVRRIREYSVVTGLNEKNEKIIEVSPSSGSDFPTPSDGAWFVFYIDDKLSRFNSYSIRNIPDTPIIVWFNVNNSNTSPLEGKLKNIKAIEIEVPISDIDSSAQIATNIWNELVDTGDDFRLTEISFGDIVGNISVGDTVTQDVSNATGVVRLIDRMVLLSPPVGGWSGGPIFFKEGDKVSQGGATGFVVRDVTNSNEPVYLDDVTGTFNNVDEISVEGEGNASGVPFQVENKNYAVIQNKAGSFNSVNVIRVTANDYFSNFVVLPASTVYATNLLVNSDIVTIPLSVYSGITPKNPSNYLFNYESQVIENLKNQFGQNAKITDGINKFTIVDMSRGGPSLNVINNAQIQYSYLSLLRENSSIYYTLNKPDGEGNINSNPNIGEEVDTDFYNYSFYPDFDERLRATNNKMKVGGNINPNRSLVDPYVDQGDNYSVYFNKRGVDLNTWDIFDSVSDYNSDYSSIELWSYIDSNSNDNSRTAYQLRAYFYECFIDDVDGIDNQIQIKSYINNDTREIKTDNVVTPVYMGFSASNETLCVELTDRILQDGYTDWGDKLGLSLTSPASGVIRSYDPGSVEITITGKFLTAPVKDDVVIIRNGTRLNISDWTTVQDGDTVTIVGPLATKTYEFDTDSSVTPGNVAVDISNLTTNYTEPQRETAIMLILAQTINSQQLVTGVTAVPNGSYIDGAGSLLLENVVEFNVQISSPGITKFEDYSSAKVIKYVEDVTDDKIEVRPISGDLLSKNGYSLIYSGQTYTISNSSTKIKPRLVIDVPAANVSSFVAGATIEAPKFIYYQSVVSGTIYSVSRNVIDNTVAGIDNMVNEDEPFYTFFKHEGKAIQEVEITAIKDTGSQFGPAYYGIGNYVVAESSPGVQISNTTGIVKSFIQNPLDPTRGKVVVGSDNYFRIEQGSYILRQYLDDSLSVSPSYDFYFSLSAIEERTTKNTLEFYFGRNGVLRLCAFSDRYFVPDISYQRIRLRRNNANTNNNRKIFFQDLIINNKDYEFTFEEIEQRFSYAGKEKVVPFELQITETKFNYKTFVQDVMIRHLVEGSGSILNRYDYINRIGSKEHHIAYTYSDDNGHTLYIDGVASDTNTSPIVQPYTEKLKIGVTQGTAGQKIYLQDLATYSNELSSADVNDRYNYVPSSVPNPWVITKKFIPEKAVFVNDLSIYSGGIFRVDISNPNGVFFAGETVTDGTETATVVLYDQSNNKLYVKDLSSPFAPSSTLTGDDSGATATVDSVVVVLNNDDISRQANFVPFILANEWKLSGSYNPAHTYIQDISLYKRTLSVNEIKQNVVFKDTPDLEPVVVRIGDTIDLSTGEINGKSILGKNIRIVLL